jgi:hypothetical protein
LNDPGAPTTVNPSLAILRNFAKAGFANFGVFRRLSTASSTVPLLDTILLYVPAYLATLRRTGVVDEDTAAAHSNAVFFPPNFSRLSGPTEVEFSLEDSTLFS